ncbi:MAG: DUF4920 domain-containing protein [Bacteroidales bacterium]|nr:DUF4920 domain-containing protein [Bacteroidales bacterium]MCF8456366.1 DUF4920 domain-containing protein [Bacteroidales bacterium]
MNNKLNMSIPKFIFLGFALFLFACNGNPKTGQTTDNVQYKITKHGENITSEGALNPEEFLKQFEGKDSLRLKLTAQIEEVCAKKGCWMSLDISDEYSMLVRFKDYGFFVPKDAAGKMATVKGVARIDTISVAEQRHYLEDSDASQEEIDAITEPEISYTFEATGVIIKEEIPVSDEEK